MLSPGYHSLRRQRLHFGFHAWIYLFFSRFLSWLILKELHRGNLPPPHSKLPALVTSRAFYPSGAFFPGDKFEFTAQPESNRIKRGALQGSPRVID